MTVRILGRKSENLSVQRERPLLIRRRSPPGSPPGTMIAPASASKPVIDVIAYGPDSLIERSDVAPEDIAGLRDGARVTWVNVTGLGDVELLKRVAADFNLHKLAMEDVVNLHQRPKAEEFDDHVFLVGRMPREAAAAGTEQVSMFLGSDYVLCFQEQSGDCFEPLRERIRTGTGRVRQAGADYLCYGLLDAIVDGYFPVLERFSDQLEELEDDLVVQPENRHMAELHDRKRELLHMRRAVWPHREMINMLIRDENSLIAAETRLYLRDVYDHLLQLIDIIETYREITTGLVDVYMSSVSVSLNETMQVLTVIATIFIPLGFIASLYGMNFDRSLSPWNMPELGWYLGYPFALLLMFGVAVAMLFQFWRRGWLRGRARRGRPDSSRKP